MALGLGHDPARAGSFLGTNWDWVLAIVFLVITVRIILFPIFVKQIRSQRAMQALQPKMKELQAKHKGDQQTLREEMMKLYQTEKVNPLMGCLPHVPADPGLPRPVPRAARPQPGRHHGPATLYGWTGDAVGQRRRRRGCSPRRSPAHFARRRRPSWRTSTPSGVTVKIVAGVLVLIMMVTTFMTSRQMILKTGWSQDPQQRMIQKLMLYGIPFSLLLSGWYFPIGVIIYWVTQNLFSLGQQYWVLRKYPPPVTAGNIPMKSARSAAAPGLARLPGRAVIQAKPGSAQAEPARSAADPRRFLRRKPDRAAAGARGPVAGTEAGSQAGEADAAHRRGGRGTGQLERRAPPDAKPKSTDRRWDDHYRRRRAEGRAAQRPRRTAAAERPRRRPAAVRPAGRSTTKKVGGTPRKGQPNRKGGAKR